MLAAADFIPAIEDSDIIDRVTSTVLASALRQVSSWRHQGLRIPVAVNIATRSLLDLAFPTMVGTLLDQLDQLDLGGELLCLEITENIIMRNPERAVTVLQSLRSRGVRISIDDYGTGYASMSYLKNLPIDELKIDRSFVTHMASDPHNLALTTSVVELGHNLGLTVVAEGVEDSDVAQLLRDCGCDIAQGYYYARPMAAEQILRWRSDNQSGSDAVPAHRRVDSPVAARAS